MRRLRPHVRLGTLLVAVLAIGCQSSVEPRRGAATAIVLESGGQQGANVGSALPIAPAVKVINSARVGVPGVRVNFAISSGGGAITGATVTTDENGIAELGSWTIGSVGENQVTATVSGLAPFAISAVGRCIAGGSITIDAFVSGELSNTDCRYANGEFTDRYAFTTTAQRAIRFTQTSAAVNSFLELQGPGNVVAFNDDASATTDNSMFKVLLAPGTYDVNPSSRATAEVGAYTISVAAVPESEPGCEVMFAVANIETVQTLATDDCISQTFRYDAVAVYLHAGQTYVFTMSSPAFDTYLELLEYSSQRLVISNDDISSTNTNARISYTPTISTFYLLVASNAVASGLGAYTLGIH